MVDGLVVVDKPAGMTSHDVVGRCRRIFGQRRVGHAGTLDPDATGVLLVGLGRATRLLRWVTALPKSYTGEIVLGTETSTLDSSGEVLAIHDMTGVTLDNVRAAAANLVGDIDQVPPMVSAVKVGGRRLHELAREGRTVDRQPRRVSVHGFDVSDGPDPLTYSFLVECSSGTYVRTLAADVGTALGGGAHLRNLRRTAIGGFVESDAIALQMLEAAPAPDLHVLAPAACVRHLSSVTVDEATAAAIAHGAILSDDWPELPPWALHDNDGRLLAVYEERPDGRKQAAVVLAL